MTNWLLHENWEPVYTCTVESWFLLYDTDMGREREFVYMHGLKTHSRQHTTQLYTSLHMHNAIAVSTTMSGTATPPAGFVGSKSHLVQSSCATSCESGMPSQICVPCYRTPPARTITRWLSTCCMIVLCIQSVSTSMFQNRAQNNTSATNDLTTPTNRVHTPSHRRWKELW